LLIGLFAIGCAGAGRTAFAPESGPPTVGMPAELNERERLFVTDIEASLRDNGLVPVRHGAGDMALEFTMAAGPVNTDTRIALLDGRRTVARGSGRASGVPLIGRSSVAEKSFSRAFEQFQSELSEARSRRGWRVSGSSAPVSEMPVY
jgi:hypothetical protein